MTKYVYTFGGGSAEGKASDKNLLGGKGANLAEMCSLGIPVPAGFTISTECCTAYYADGCKFPDELTDQVLVGMKKIELIMEKKYGRCHQYSSGLLSFRCAFVHARNDGYSPQCRALPYHYPRHDR